MNDSIIVEEKFEFEYAYKDVTLLNPFFHDVCKVDLDKYTYSFFIADDFDIQSAFEIYCDQCNLKRIVSLIKGKPTFLEEVQDSLITCFPEFCVIEETLQQSQTANSIPTPSALMLLETLKPTPLT